MASKPPFVGERVAFSEAFKEVSRGVSKYKQVQYLEQGIHPIVDQGKALIAGFSNDEEGLFRDVPAIVFGDHTRIVKYINEPFFAGADGVKILKPVLSSNARYWYHALRAAKIDNLGYSRHFKLLKEKKFSNPIEDTQLTICNNLDTILNHIDLANQEIERLDQLIKSRFVEMFGEEKSANQTPIESVCDLIVDCPHETPKYEGELQYPAIRTSEIGTGLILWDTMKYVSEDEYIKRTRRAVPEPDDIVYAREGSYGNAVLLPQNPAFCLGQRTMLFRPNKNVVHPVYLLHAVLSDDFRMQADILNVGSTVPHVNVRDAKKFLVPVPPFESQCQFASFVVEVDKLRFVVQQQIEKLQTLYDSLAQEYFGD